MGSEFVSIGVSSLILNAANFVLFDLVLAAAVYVLTADLAGLVNSTSALKAKDEPIAFHSPAFVGVGVGITCTKKIVFYVLAFLRIISVLFIFISSTSFIGGTQCVDAEKEANVKWIGNFFRKRRHKYSHTTHYSSRKLPRSNQFNYVLRRTS